MPHLGNFSLDVAVVLVTLLSLFEPFLSCWRCGSELEMERTSSRLTSTIAAASQHALLLVPTHTHCSTALLFCSSTDSCDAETAAPFPQRHLRLLLGEPEGIGGDDATVQHYPEMRQLRATVMVGAGMKVLPHRSSDHSLSAGQGLEASWLEARRRLKVERPATLVEQ